MVKNNGPETPREEDAEASAASIKSTLVEPVEGKRRTSAVASADQKVRLAGVQLLKKKGGSGKLCLAMLRDADTPDLQDEVSGHEGFVAPELTE